MVTTDKIKSLLGVMRPAQWVKNSFVLAPLLFSHQFTHPDNCKNTLLAFLSFCLISSVIYVINDICDRNEDRVHPVKKHRPLAAGRLSVHEAVGLSIILLAVGIVLAISVNTRFVAILIIYILLNIGYSLGLKHLVILDVMIVAAGFVLRILGGSLAIEVPASHWLVLCTILISLFLGFTKRRAELVSSQNNNQHARKVLKDYSIAFLDQVISMVTGATIVCYALYTVDARTMDVFGTRAMILTVPLVIYGLFRYIYIIYYLNEGEDPTRSLLRDLPTIINLLLWIAVSLLVVLYGHSFSLFG